MSRLPLALALVFALACTRQVVVVGEVVPPGPLVFVAAHPDDELYLSPLLERLCAQQGRRCTLVVLSRGEQGHCVRPDGCPDGLARVRAAELAAAADRLRLARVAWDLGDVRGQTGAEAMRGWEARAGGAEALAARLGEVLEVEKPALLLTFDPRHGTTCHGAHRAVGALALRVAAKQGVTTRWVIASRRTPGLGIVPAEGAAARAAYARSFDAAEWSVVVELMRLYPSQFTQVQVARVANAPRSDRTLVLLDARDVPADALEDVTFCAGGAVPP